MIPFVTANILSVLVNFIVNNNFGNCYLSCFLERATSTSVIHEGSPLVPFDGDYEPFARLYLNINEDDENLKLLDAMQIAIEMGCQCWIIDVDIAISFLDAFEELVHKVTLQRPVRSKVLFHGELLMGSGQFQENPQIQQIFNSSVTAGIPDALFIIPSSNSPCSACEENFHFDLLSPKAVGRFNVAEPVLINSVRVDLEDPQQTHQPVVRFKYESVELFSTRSLLNLEGRYVKISTFNYYPYSSYEEVAPGTGNANSMELMNEALNKGAQLYPEKSVVLDGTESLVVIEFCKKYNCTLLLVPDDGGQWGEIYDNYTGNGVLGSVAMKTGEMGYGALYMWYHEHLYVDYSPAVSRSGITAIVPNPHVLDPLLIALLPFTASLWLLVFLCMIGESLALGLIERAHHIINETTPKENLFVNSTLHVFQIHILQSIKFGANTISQRCLWLSIIVGGFIIGSSFSGSLSSFMTIPRYEAAIEPAIMAQKNLHWAGTHNAWIYSIMESESPVTSTIRKNFELHPQEKLMEMNLGGQMNFAVERLPYDYFAFGDYIQRKTMEDLRVMREDIYFEYAVVAVPNGWYLKDQLDDLVLIVQQSGIQKYWLMVTTYKQLNPSVQKSIGLSNIRHGDSAASKPLAITRLAGIFYMLGFGLAIALGVFIAELIYAKHFTRL